MLCILKAAGLNSQELIVYKGYIRSLLEYAAPLWYLGLTKQQVDQVENIQKRVCKYILGRNYKSYTESLATLEMKTLHDRRVDICRDFAGKVLASDRFSTWFTPPVQNSIMQLRRSHVVKPFRYKTERFKSSLLPYMANLLNFMISFSLLTKCNYLQTLIMTFNLTSFLSFIYVYIYLLL